MCGIFFIDKNFEIIWNRVLNADYKELWRAYTNKFLIKEENFNLGKNRGPIH